MSKKGAATAMGGCLSGDRPLEKADVQTSIKTGAHGGSVASKHRARGSRKSVWLCTQRSFPPTPVGDSIRTTEADYGYKITNPPSELVAWSVDDVERWAAGLGLPKASLAALKV